MSYSVTIPQFPDFKYLEMSDREFLHQRFFDYQPETSEWTFTNLFVWREYYRYQWSVLNGNLLVLCNPLGWGHYFLMPIGGGNRLETTRTMLAWLKNEKEEYDPRIERTDERFVKEIAQDEGLIVEPVRDQFDYVYSTQNLIQLEGRKYHAKKNHINRFQSRYAFEYKTMDTELSKECRHVLKRWCDWRECEKNPIMQAEMEACQETLKYFQELRIEGGVILANGKVIAFTLGELLNSGTAVIHVEKIDPDVPEGFAVINQQFCEHAWSNIPFINREQDLGVPGLRRAKQSYNPIKMVEKFRVRLKTE